MSRTLDAIILSDLHLGSTICQVSRLDHFLHHLPDTQRLILAGDVLDCVCGIRLSKSHWKILSRLRKLSGRMAITWISGNHDEEAGLLSQLIGAEWAEEMVFETGGKNCRVLHGHQFDDFLLQNPVTVWLSDVVYQFLQRIDPSHGVARWGKRSSKIFLDICRKVREGAIRRAVNQGSRIVVCGHTHLAETYHDVVTGVVYANSGSWTEKPCTYLAVSGGEVELRIHQ